jgi:hypothetical protein
LDTGKCLYNLWPFGKFLLKFGIFYDRPFGLFCVHLVHFSVFGIMYQEKSGNPESLAIQQPEQ